MDAASDLSRANLASNFAYWIAKWDPCVVPQESEQVALSLPTTHTFASEIWAGDKARFPYREILFEDEALLSRRYRAVAGKIHVGDPVRQMDRATQVKLDHFVFSYLAVHDPYYASQDDLPPGAALTQRPFGVFVPVDLDNLVDSNATRRDLASPEAEWPPHREFFLPRDARIFSHYQSRNDARHRDSFWHYWGGYEYWLDPMYIREEPWQWRIEFHHKDFVAVKQFSGLLWPTEMVSLEAGGWKSTSDDEIESFTNAYPTCAVIPYTWDPAEPSRSFIKASYAVIRYYLACGIYPETADDAWRFLENGI